MAKTKSTPYALPFCAVIYSSEDIHLQALSFLVNSLSPVTFSLGPVVFSDFTSYYQKEMGEALKKMYYFFSTPVPLEDFHKIKLETNIYETSGLKKDDSRKVNLDPGYLTEAKFVLYSVKDYSRKVYINNGIYADVQLEFKKNTYTSHNQTYKDYKTFDFISFANDARNYFRACIGK